MGRHSFLNLLQGLIVWPWISQGLETQGVQWASHIDENAENKKQKVDHRPTDANYGVPMSRIGIEATEFSENGQNGRT